MACCCENVKVQERYNGERVGGVGWGWRKKERERERERRRETERDRKGQIEREIESVNVMFIAEIQNTAYDELLCHMTKR